MILSQSQIRVKYHVFVYYKILIMSVVKSECTGFLHLIIRQLFMRP